MKVHSSWSNRFVTDFTTNLQVYEMFTTVSGYMLWKMGFRNMARIALTPLAKKSIMLSCLRIDL